jgi:nitrate reductase gamma subunit
MEAWLELARGPLFRLALAIFCLGLLRHVVITILAVRTAIGKAGDKKLPIPAIRKATVRWVFPTQAYNENKAFSVASVVFHVGVILAPLFLATHIAMIERSTGLSWFHLPNLVVDALTLAAIAGVAIMLYLRLTTPQGRALSRGQDLGVLAVIGLLFLSGFLAMHPSLNPIPFEFTLLGHILLANVALFMAPFTKLVHIALMPATQYVSEVGWHFVPDAGEKVAKALGKENQPI